MAERAQFDHYEVLTRDDGSLRELGRGAMGITYKAFDSNLRVPVALKVINSGHLDNDSARSRFISEARAAALLRHRHVASVFHLGIDGDTYFYAMEYIDGETAEELVRREGPLAVGLALSLTMQVTRALSAAQRHNLVHRDIKPANLMLVTEDEEVCVKVIDFGLAKSDRRESSQQALETVAGFVGTPHFASPEQLEEKSIDVRSDLYSLGATLWYLLTGKPPFAGTLAQVINSQLSKAPDLGAVEHLPQEVSAVLGRLLAKNPADRFQTPADLRLELERILPGLPAEPGLVGEAEAVDALQEEHARHGERPFKRGDLAAGHYEILEDRGEGVSGSIFHARDQRTGREVRLVVVTPGLIEDPQAFTTLEHDVEKLQKLEHRNVLQVISLELADVHTLLVMEWTRGFSLVELLRTRREIEPEDTLPIVKQLASAADFATEHQLERVDFALHRLAVDFPEMRDTAAADELKRRPVAGWPVFLAKVNPIGFARVLSSSDTWAGGQTIVGGISGENLAKTSGESMANHLRAVAAVTYELLGGSPLLGASGGLHNPSGRYVPLAMLSERGNDVLKRALQPDPGFENARAYHEELERACRESLRPSASRSSAAGLNALAQVHAAAEQEAWETRQSPLLAPAKQKRPFPLVLAIGAGIFVLFILGILLAPLFTGSIPGEEAKPRLEEPVRIAAGKPAKVEPASEPVPTRDQALANAVKQAEAYEREGNWLDAMAASLSIVQEYPQAEVGRLRIEMLLTKMRSPEVKLSQADFNVLRPSIEAAAKLDAVPAMMLLAENLRRSEPKVAFDWYCSAAALGSPEAFTQVGLMYSNGAGVPTDLNKAVWWFREAAERKDPAGMACLGECYLYGKGVPRDPAEAARILTEAVALNDPRAMNQLGTLYHQGRGVEQNFSEALRLFTEAVKRGRHDALGNLGVLYNNGDGVPRDLMKAVDLFADGSRQGDAYCMYLYARSLESGTGVAPNEEEAKSWYQKSAALGHPGAIAWCKAKGIAIPVTNADATPAD